MADPSGGVLEARNARFEANWGDPTTLGKLVTQPVTLNEEARTVRLSWNGTGVSFMVSTDNGKTWENVANGKATALQNPGNRLVLKAMLQMAATTALDSYSLEVNPANFSLFTGKMLTEETGLVYYNARWYDSEIGRFVTADTYTFLPGDERNFDETADKGFKILSEEPQRYNPYVFCTNSPVNRIDPDGHVGEAVIGPIVEKAGEVVVKAAIGVGSAVIAWGSGVVDAVGDALVSARRQVFKKYPTRKKAKDAADKVGRHKGKNGKPEGPEQHDKGTPHYHDKNHDDPTKPNVHYGYPD
jgi:RHS repeat-associated protein